MAARKTSPQPRIHLAEARTMRGWSQQKVADHVGTTYVNVSRWERGITRPNPYFRRKLCALYSKSEAELNLEPVAKAVVVPVPVSDPPPPVPVSSSPPSLPVAEPVAPVRREAIYDPAIPLRQTIRLVGRDAALAQLRQRLCTGGSIALTALNGLPGVGKTALSIALAHDDELRAHFQDGILWAALGPDPNIPGLLSRWGKLLGVSATEMATLSNTGAWSRALRNAIGSRFMLLVIDDAWKLEDALNFQVGGPNCAHLLTTRFPHIATHVALDGATMLQELSEEESMTLLRMLAPTVVEREVTKAHDLVHAVGGLPLALTLMGNYLRKQGYSGQTRRIHAALERLSDAEERLQVSEPHGPAETHPSLAMDTPLSLQSVIAVTDQQLSQSARAALYALSAFPPKPNSFSEDAALAVAACSVDDLDTLTDMGMLESGGADRYTLHQTIADYARLRLKGTEAHERLIAYATTYVENHKTDYELLDQESSIVLAALEAAHDLGQPAELVRAVSAFAPFLLLRGSYALAELHLQRAHQAAITLEDHYGITTALLYLGQVAQKQGNFAQAEATYQEGLKLARYIENSERISALLADLGWITWRLGNYTQAEAYVQEGLTLARQIGNNGRISGLLEILGSITTSRGEYAQSEAYLLEGLQLARQIGDREKICALLINLGVTEAEQGHDTQAEKYLQEGLIIARQIGHREWISLLLLNLGSMANEQGDHARAETYFQEGLIHARQIAHREWTCILLLNLGPTAWKQGNRSQAEAYLQESLTLARQIGRPRIITNALYEYGTFLLDQQRIEEAGSSFSEMLPMIPEGDQVQIALAQYGLARVALAQGSVQEARTLGETSLTVLNTIGHHKAQEVRQWLDKLV